MTPITTGALMLVRLCGLILIVLGLLIWTGHAENLKGIHLLLGVVLVFALWTLAAQAAQAAVRPVLVALAVIWGLITPILGLAQENLLPNGGHWIVQILHLAIGLGAIGLAEALGAAIKRRPTAGQAPGSPATRRV